VWDIYLGIAIMMLLAAGLFALGRRVAQRTSRRGVALLAALGVAGIALHAFWLLEHPLLAWLLPFSNLVVVGDPSVGREKWHVDSLKVLWGGMGLRLVKRVE
jgi:formate hydrogenlyase subunit 3/multisubunit Na+/H+ antiporter MnhD subunit